MFDEYDDFFDFRFGPFQMGFGVRPGRVSYSKTEDSHVLKIKLRKDLTKEDIKVRLQEDGILEVTWPRKKGEDVTVE